MRIMLAFNYLSVDMIMLLYLNNKFFINGKTFTCFNNFNKLNLSL